MPVRDPITLADGDLPAWEQQPGETPRAHARFTAYRDAGPARTLAATASALGLTASHVRHLAVAYRWQERAAAWDQRDAEQWAEQWAEARSAAMRQMADVGDHALTLAMERLRTINPDTLSVTELCRLAEVGLKAHASAAALAPLAPTDADGQDAGPDYAAMSREERAERYDAALAELQRRRGLVAVPGGAAG